MSKRNAPVPSPRDPQYPGSRHTRVQTITPDDTLAREPFSLQRSRRVTGRDALQRPSSPAPSYRTEAPVPVASSSRNPALPPPVPAKPDPKVHRNPVPESVSNAWNQQMENRPTLGLEAINFNAKDEHSEEICRKCYFILDDHGYCLKGCGQNSSQLLAYAGTAYLYHPSKDDICCPTCSRGLGMAEGKKLRMRCYCGGKIDVVRTYGASLANRQIWACVRSDCEALRVAADPKLASQTLQRACQGCGTRILPRRIGDQKELAPRSILAKGLSMVTGKKNVPSQSLSDRPIDIADRSRQGHFERQLDIDLFEIIRVRNEMGYPFLRSLKREIDRDIW
ncbi:hypothetical protein P7C73_g3657, partial [Tremellales sp. Uapishka_1]